MRKFLIESFIFSVLVIITITFFVMRVNHKIRDGRFFELPKHSSMIVLGNSHPECALNDAYISDFSNCAQSSEAYFYNHLKLRELIDENKQLKTVFIEFSNSQITKKIDNYVFGDEYLNWRFCRFNPMMKAEDYQFLLKHNPLKILEVQNIALRENTEYLKKDLPYYISGRSLGGYLQLNYKQVDSSLKEKTNLINLQKIINVESDKNLFYLRKCINLCRQHNINVYLIRCPQHPLFEDWSNEKLFQKTRLEKFKDIEFLDFGKLKLKKAEYADLSHLNVDGAKHFSVFFDSLVKSKVLSKQGKQLIIDASWN